MLYSKETGPEHKISWRTRKGKILSGWADCQSYPIRCGHQGRFAPYFRYNDPTEFPLPHRRYRGQKYRTIRNHRNGNK